MVIRKLYKFCAGHIVRNCSSERCRKSLHGHNYEVEVFFTSNKLDNGHMLLDFGLTKGNIKDFIDGFDHCWQFWDKESKNFKEFIDDNSARWIQLPVSPSAEQYSLMFLFVIDKIVKATSFNNGEGHIEVSSVRVHETDTGYAEAFREDLDWVNYRLEDIVLSEQVKNEWQDYDMYDNLTDYHNKIESVDYRFNTARVIKPFVNNTIPQQI